MRTDSPLPREVFDKKKKFAFLVFGMHRSGTSLITRLLSLTGCELPKTLLGSDPGNKKGYWESVPILTLNEEILASAGSMWNDWRPFDAGWYTSSVAHEFRKHALEVLSEEVGDSRQFVLKDPRMCRLAPFWIEAVRMYGAEPLIVSPIRSPLDVAASLEAHTGIEPSTGKLLWLRHVLDAEKATRDLKRAWLRYDMLFVKPYAIIDALGETLDVSWLRAASASIQLEINQFIGRDLRHRQSNDAELSRDPELSWWIKSSFDILDRWTREDVHDEDIEKLDEIRSAFDEAIPAFIHTFASDKRAVEERDGRIEALRRAVEERDGRIEALRRAVEERDGRIEALHRSRSWRMTAPLRELRRMQRALTRKTPIVVSSPVPRPVDVLIPVCDAFLHTRRCLESILLASSKMEDDINIIVIDDARSDVRITEYLEYMSNCGLITLLTNSKNMGFVQTVNRSMQLNIEHDVVLLNSDTEVAGDWVTRLRKCAYRDKSIGTVTPFSNNAEICSFPRLCRVNDLFDGLGVAEIDTVFSQLDEYEPVDIPSAIGFCMYIKRDCLTEIGYFDFETFGRGYGAENAFCMRASHNGWRNVLCPNVFVYHEGGGSFGPEKKERMDRALAIMDALYPAYHGMVAEHILLNPAKVIRFHAMLELMRLSKKPRVLHLTHALGGGTHKHVVELAEYLSSKILPIRAMPDNEKNIVLFLNGEDLDMTMTFSAKETKSLLRFLKFIGICSIHIHQIFRVPDWVVDLVRSTGLPYDLTIHDYYYLTGNPTFPDDDGAFVFNRTTRKIIRDNSNFTPKNHPFHIWREGHRTFIENAQRVFVPCTYVRDIHYKHFPNVNYVLAFHPEKETKGIYPDVFIPELGSEERIRIVVLGVLSKAKGADLLEHTSLGTSIECEFHLVGHSYRPIDDIVVTHGPYRGDQLDEIIGKINPHVIWFPARLHETYSYTLSEAMRNGRAVIVPNVGAFPERVRNRPFTWIECWNKPDDEWVRYFNELRSVLQDEKGKSLPWIKQPKHDFDYSSDYMKSTAFSRPLPLSHDSLDKRWLKNNEANISWKQNTKEKLFLALVRIYFRANDREFSRWIVKMIPYRTKRLVKSWLTNKSLHEFIDRLRDTRLDT